MIRIELEEARHQLPKNFQAKGDAFIEKLFTSPDRHTRYPFSKSPVTHELELALKRSLAIKAQVEIDQGSLEKLKEGNAFRFTINLLSQNVPFVFLIFYVDYGGNVSNETIGPLRAWTVNEVTSLVQAMMGEQYPDE
jgi:hypothetical protein